MILSIDIGTSHSSAATLRNGNPEAIVPQSENSASVPSAVFVEENGNLLIGSKAIHRRNSAPSNFIENFKLHFLRDEEETINGIPYSMDQFYAEFYRFFRDSAKSNGIVVDKVTITHPAQLSEEKQLALRKIAQEVFNLPNSDITLMDEPAAAMNTFLKDRVKKGDVVMVYDFGGGTLDLTLAEVTYSGLKILGSEKEDLGGVVFDRLIIADAEQNGGVDKEALENAIVRNMLVEEAVKAKHALSVSHFYDMQLPSKDYAPKEHRLTRERFNELIEPYLKKSDALVERLLSKTERAKDDVAKVLCVGGSTRVPLVVSKLENMFKDKLLMAANPELAVCLGGAMRPVGALEKDPRLRYSLFHYLKPVERGE
ncbi:hypothetical protein AGMMS50276_03650 [Synergistales bacterium]|nr:hypothetical protein AGMMS50276_03650 [Synergistales bacterium]